MKAAVVEKPAFCWFGEQIGAPPSSRKLADLPHYRGCTIGELTVEIGDFVILKGESPSDSLLECDIARLESLYEDRSDKSSPYRATVTWLCRPAQLPTQLKNNGHGYEEDGIPNLDDRLDVVIEARRFDTTIDAETIYYKCNVISQPMSTNPEQAIKSLAKSGSKHPNYVIRFKMIRKSPKGNQYILEPYQKKGDPSPLKLSNRSRSPLKEVSSVRCGSASPELAPSPKIEIPASLFKLYCTQNPDEDIDEETDTANDDNADTEIRKRRRLSSRGSNSREQTPMKRLKKSTSVQNTPEKVDVNSPRTGRSTRKSVSTHNTPAVVDSPSTRSSRSRKPLESVDSPSGRAMRSRKTSESTDSPLKKVLESPKAKSTRSIKALEGTESPTVKSTRSIKALEGTESPIVKSTRSRKPSESTESPIVKSTRSRKPSESTESPTVKSTRSRKPSESMIEEPKLAVRSSRRSIVPLSYAESPEIQKSKPKKEEIKAGEKSVSKPKGVKSSEKFTEVVAQTGSGRKVKITCGDRPKKIAPSSGLGKNEISCLLDSDSDQDFQEKVEDKIKKSDRIKKSGTATPAKEDQPKKRTRRASMSVVEKPVLSTPSVKSKRRSTAFSETKVKKKLTKHITTSESDSDFEPSDHSDKEEAYQKKIIQKKKETPLSKTQRKSILDKKGFTPGVQRRAKPVPCYDNPLVEAQARLHVSAVPDSLPCREEEFAEVLSYVEGKLEEGTGGCIYISGVPGTGKTATVKQVIRYMTDNRDEFPDFTFHELNGMRLTCPEQIYVEMWRLLSGGEKLSTDAALKRLDERFSKPAPRRSPTVFLVDELDMLCKRKQTVLYNIFEWPSRPQAKIIIIAIANTMDLPERDMDMRVISRLGFNRLHFEPYNQQQLQIIVSSRLEGLEVFQSDEIQLVSRKVASLSGDARRALDICRILAERCEREGKARVTTIEVMQVHKEMFTSPKMQFIRSCSKLEQFLLRSLVNEFYRTGVEESNLRNVSHRMMELCSSESLQVPSLYCLYNLCARLSSQRLILSEDYRKGLETKIRLNVGFEDVNFALRPPRDLE